MPWSPADKKDNNNSIECMSKLDSFLNTTFDLAEANTKLVGSLAHEHALLAEQDKELQNLSEELDRSTQLSQELAALNLRSDFFEAQLSLLEVHTAVNAARGTYSDWKDRSLNWRTTETTLENLELEYRYLMSQFKLHEHTKQPDEPYHDSNHDSFNTTVDSVFSHHDDTTMLSSNTSFDDVQLRPIRCKSQKKESFHVQTVKKHASLPLLQESNRGKFESFLPEELTTSLENEKQGLRHELSFDTAISTREQLSKTLQGLTFEKRPVATSPSSLMSHLKVSQLSDDEDYGEETETLDIYEPSSPTIKRCASHESIFFKESEKEPAKSLDLKQQTMKWLSIFHTPATAAQNNYNATNSLEKNSPPIIQHTPAYDTTSQATPTIVSASSQSSRDMLSSVVSARPIPIPSSSASSLRAPSISSSSSFMASQQYSQWSLLLAKLNQHSIIPTVYTEVGKPLEPPERPEPQRRFGEVTRTFNGSHSTITIGPNQKKIVRHGPSSDLHRHVVATRVSYAALRDALDSDLM